MSDTESVVVEHWTQEQTETSDGQEITFSRQSHNDYCDSELYEEIHIIASDYGQLEFYVSIDVTVDGEAQKLMRAPKESFEEALDDVNQMCEVYNDFGLVGVMIRDE